MEGILERREREQLFYSSIPYIGPPPENEKIYLILGHGITRTTERISIPINRRIAYTAHCGDKIDEDAIIHTESLFFLQQLEPLNRKEPVEYYDRWHDENIKVKQYKSNLTDSEITLLLWYPGLHGRVVLNTSGIYEYTKTKHQTMEKILLDIDENGANIISQDDVKQAFKNSIYPTVENVLELFTDYTQEEEGAKVETLPFDVFEKLFQFSKKISSLMKNKNKKPILIIASSCRIFDEEIDIDEQINARINSFGIKKKKSKKKKRINRRKSRMTKRK